MPRFYYQGSSSGGGAPSGNAGGDLGGTYPNPTVAVAKAKDVDFKSKTDGNFSINSSSFAVIDATNLDATVVGATGDLIEVAVSGSWFGNAGGGEGHLRVVTIDPTNSNAVINGFGNGTDGVPAWGSFVETEYKAISGSIFYQLLAGDIKNGNAKIRLEGKRGGAGTRPIAANSAVPLILYVVNHGSVLN